MTIILCIIYEIFSGERHSSNGTSGTLALDLPGFGHHHAALRGDEDDGGAPATLMPTPTLIHVVIALKPTCSKICTHTRLKTCLINHEGTR